MGNTHLNVALKYAGENADNGRMISKSLWNEILLYLSLQRQVHKAFDLVGVKNYSGRVVRVEHSDGRKGIPKIEANQKKKDFWGVNSMEELLEKMAVFHVDNY